MKTLEKLSAGCTITGPGLTAWHKTIIAFVDDTKQFLNQFTDPNNPIKDMIRDATIWHRLLQCTGGDVNFKKSGHTILKWCLNKQGIM